MASMSIEQLVADAGVPRSTFYVYFSDKAAVFREVLDQFADFTVQTIVRASDPLSVTQDHLRSALALGVSHYGEHQGTYRLLADAAATEPSMATIYKNATDRVIVALARTVAQWGGRTRPNRRDRTLASALIWMVERTLYQELNRAVGVSEQGLIDALTAVIWPVAQAERHTQP